MIIFSDFFHYTISRELASLLITNGMWQPSEFPPL